MIQIKCKTLKRRNAQKAQKTQDAQKTQKMSLRVITGHKWSQCATLFVFTLVAAIVLN
jgi:hypothetical protein